MAGLWLVGCYGPSGEHGGRINAGPSDPYGITNADAVKGESAGAGSDPFGGIYNYQEIDFGPPTP